MLPILFVVRVNPLFTEIWLVETKVPFISDSAWTRQNYEERKQGPTDLDELQVEVLRGELSRIEAE